MPGKSYQGDLPALQKEEITLENLLKQSVHKIAVEIGSRNAGQYDKLNSTKAFLETVLSQAGYQVTRQEYQINNKIYYNLAVEKVGTVHPNEVIIIGAHYDSAFTSPGANDNETAALGALLESTTEAEVHQLPRLLS